MRLVGLALLSAWLVAWAVAPHGEAERQTSIVGAVAVAGGDTAAAAWLEVRARPAKRGETPMQDGTLHVVTVDGDGNVVERLRRVVSADEWSYRLLDAGQGRFVLATEWRSDPDGALQLVRFSTDDAAGQERIETLRPRTGSGETELRSRLAGVAQGVDWQIAAVGRQVAAVERRPHSATTWLHVLGADGAWIAEETEGRTLVGGGGGHLVVYVEHHDRTGSLRVDPGQADEWKAEVARSACFADGGAPPTVTSVVGLRGGYARLSRRGPLGCVDGIRDGTPFVYKDVPLGEMAAARLAVADDGQLDVHEEQQAQQLEQVRIRLPASARPPGRFLRRLTASREPDARYRLFGGRGSQGVTVLTTRVIDGETQVSIDGRGLASGGRREIVLAPQRRFLPDYRPALRLLAGLPMAVLLLAFSGTYRTLRRIGGLVLSPSDAPLAHGRIAVEGELCVDAEAPVGGLRMRHGRHRLTVFLEGAEVLRASDVRPRSQPRGDAVDVASGAKIVATGVLTGDQLYRQEAILRAGRGDLVVVGCTLVEARARLASRLATTAAVLTLATLVALTLALAS